MTPNMAAGVHGDFHPEGGGKEEEEDPHVGERGVYWEC